MTRVVARNEATRKNTLSRIARKEGYAREEGGGVGDEAKGLRPQVLMQSGQVFRRSSRVRDSIRGAAGTARGTDSAPRLGIIELE